jgi:hypothetical protein
MSRRNGDRARFQKNRKRKLLLRQRRRRLAAALLSKPAAPATPAEIVPR